MAAANPSLPPIANRLNGLESVPTGDASCRYDPSTRAVAAERVVFDSLFGEGLATTRSSLSRLADSLIAVRRTEGVDDELRTRSVDLGKRVGLAIVAWSHGDGFDSTRG